MSENTQTLPAVTLTLIGWAAMHTWQESHGEYSVTTYQKVLTDRDLWPLDAMKDGRSPSIEVYHYRDGRQEVSTGTAGYALARWVLADMEANADDWLAGPHRISPCCTSGSQEAIWVSRNEVFHLMRAAGHGTVVTRRRPLTLDEVRAQAATEVQS